MPTTAERLRQEGIKEVESQIKETESKIKETESKIKEAKTKFKKAESKIKEAESKIKKVITNLIKEGYDKLKIKELSGLSDRELNRLLSKV